MTDPASVRWVLACLAEPTSTGLSSIVARTHAIGRTDDGGALVTLGTGGRTVRVPLSPGQFCDLEVASSQRLSEGQRLPLDGVGVLAFDGERECFFTEGTVAHVDRLGPQLIDVGATLRRALDPEGP